MKTIEEKAKEYAENIRPIKGLDKFDAPFITAFEHNSDIEEAYKKGAQDLQRWIPVDEELPKHAKSVLCKCLLNRKIDYLVAKYYKSGWQINVYYSKMVNVTHWRPIEY